MSGNKELGIIGEEIAQRYLIKEGYSILEMNYRCRLGEIDIVAREGRFLVFIEVKARKGIQHGYPREAVNNFKQLKLRNLASFYLTSKSLWENRIRFDVVEIIMENDFKEKTITLIKNAF